MSPVIIIVLIIILLVGVKLLSGSKKDCAVSGWGEWGKCDTSTCRKVRTRTVTQPALNGGASCPPLRDVKVCDDPSLCGAGSQDCQYGPWSDFSPCSKDCGSGGTQTRSRGITYQPVGTGKACDQAQLTETQNCNEDHPCAGDCEWSEWSEWSGCNKICGGGTQTRTRHITKAPQGGGKSCTGADTETRPCNIQACCDLAKLPNCEPLDPQGNPLPGSQTPTCHPDTHEWTCDWVCPDSISCDDSHYPYCNPQTKAWSCKSDCGPNPPTCGPHEEAICNPKDDTYFCQSVCKNPTDGTHSPPTCELGKYPDCNPAEGETSPKWTCKELPPPPECPSWDSLPASQRPPCDSAGTVRDGYVYYPYCDLETRQEARAGTGKSWQCLRGCSKEPPPNLKCDSHTQQAVCKPPNYQWGCETRGTDFCGLTPQPDCKGALCWNDPQYGWDWLCPSEVSNNRDKLIAYLGLPGTATYPERQPDGSRGATRDLACKSLQLIGNGTECIEPVAPTTAWDCSDPNAEFSELSPDFLGALNNPRGQLVLVDKATNQLVYSDNVTQIGGAINKGSVSYDPSKHEIQFLPANTPGVNYYTPFSGRQCLVKGPCVHGNYRQTTPGQISPGDSCECFGNDPSGSPWMGPTCDLSSGTTCSGKGTLTPIAGGGFTCACQPGHAGAHCELDDGWCHSRGDIYPSGTGATCQCYQGTSGTQCEACSGGWVTYPVLGSSSAVLGSTLPTRGSYFVVEAHLKPDFSDPPMFLSSKHEVLNGKDVWWVDLTTTPVGTDLLWIEPTIKTLNGASSNVMISLVPVEPSPIYDPRVSYSRNTWLRVSEIEKGSITVTAQVDELTINSDFTISAGGFKIVSLFNSLAAVDPSGTPASTVYFRFFPYRACA